MFDGQCGFCTRCVGWLRRLDRHGRVDVVPYQAPGVPESIGATPTECDASVQWLGADGVRRQGADAVNAALGVALGTSAPGRLYRVTARLQEPAYRWVAAHRGRFPGVTPHCQAHPSGCA